MRSRSPFSALRWLSLIFILGAVVLFTLQLVRFSRVWGNFPTGLTIAGVPVGGLDRQHAAERLLEAYSVPVELHYGAAAIQLSPATVGFELDMESMLAAAELERTRQPFWLAYWDYIWGRAQTQADVPLRITYSEERLRAYLEQEIAARYDHPPTPAMPVVGTVNFQPGTPGTSLDLDGAMLLIDSALRSTNQRYVDLPLKRTSPSRPAFQNLEILIRQTADLSGFSGLMGVYLLDLSTMQELNIAYQDGQILPAHPGVAFTASSTIKIPIMISIFRRIGEETNPRVHELLKEMMTKSANTSSDALMQEYIDATLGPLEVTENLRTLGLENTFLAGHFYPGAPLLQRFETPANQRSDTYADLDPYSQTTPNEMGMLLEDIYQCAETGGGALTAAFPGEITQEECKQMMELLIGDHLGDLIQGGVPDGTVVAHKHGWVTDLYGVMHHMSDAGIVFTPGGNYVLTIFLYHPTQMIWDSASGLVADISRAVYNFYNLPQ